MQVRAAQPAYQEQHSIQALKGWSLHQRYHRKSHKWLRDQSSMEALPLRQMEHLLGARTKSRRRSRRSQRRRRRLQRLWMPPGLRERHEKYNPDWWKEQSARQSKIGRHLMSQGVYECFGPAPQHK